MKKLLEKNILDQNKLVKLIKLYGKNKKYESEKKLWDNLSFYYKKSKFIKAIFKNQN